MSASVRSRRAWGWHPLTDEWAARIVADAAVRPGELVLDIGAGHGALTAELVERGARVIAVELHPARARHLHGRFAGRPVTVVQADALSVRQRADGWPGTLAAPVAAAGGTLAAAPRLPAVTQGRFRRPRGAPPLTTVGGRRKISAAVLYQDGGGSLRLLGCGDLCWSLPASRTEGCEGRPGQRRGPSQARRPGR